MNKPVPCEFALCIYQENGRCTLCEGGMNQLGHCDYALVVDLPEEVLHTYKKQHLTRMDSYD